MDSALLRERELFKKRALATPTWVTVTDKRQDALIQDKLILIKINFRVEKKLRPESSNKSSSSASTSKKSLAPWESKPAAPREQMSYKTMTGSSQKRFAILTKIVNYMKERHLRGEEPALSIEEILDETNQLDIGSSTKTVSWLYLIFVEQQLNEFFSGYWQKLFPTIQNSSTMKAVSSSSQCLRLRMERVFWDCWNNMT